MQSGFIRLIYSSLSIAFLSSSLFSSEQFNKIDAFTSASVYHTLRIDPSKAYKDSAVITWVEYWNDKLQVFAYRVRWGTVEGQYTDSINLKPYQHETYNKVVLKPLIANTQYHVQFVRDYNHIFYNRNFTFTTPPLPVVEPIPADDPGRYNPLNAHYNNASPRFTVTNDISQIDIFTPAGKIIASIAVNPSINYMSQVKSVTSIPGVYIIAYKNSNHQIVISERSIINKY